MKLFLPAFVAAIASSTVSAFVPSTKSIHSSVSVKETIADLEALAEKANPIVKFYDPLQLSTSPIFNDTEEATIGWLRHAEIKHGRVAMAAFVGYVVQANGLHWPFPIQFDGTPYPFAAGSPPEQWDALSDPAKWQIILFVGFLEFFSEFSGTHYMRGGVPGAYPKFSDSPEVIPHPVPLNLYDPFGFTTKASAENKAAGLVKEINNGRLAMIGIMGFLAEQKVEGSVPLLRGIVDHYDGEPMAPFG